MLEKAKQQNAFYPLSYGQNALYFLYLTSPESTAYNVAVSIRILSKPDFNALRKAFQLLINKHLALRTTYAIKDGKPVQEVHGYQEVYFEEIDTLNFNEADLKIKVREVHKIPFDLERGPVFRVHLFKVSEENYILLINMHHIASDGLSIGIWLNELKLFYTSEIKGERISLQPSKATYIDYVKMQREMLSSSKGEELWNYWKKQLSGFSGNIRFPYDYPRSAVNKHKGSTVDFEITKELLNELKLFAKEEGVTLYTLLISSFLVLLHKYCNQDEIFIGSTTAGRNFIDTENIVGYFVNPIVINGKFEGNPTFKTFLKKMRETILDALKHQDFPFPLLVERLMPAREPGVTPIFQIEFGFYSIPKDDPLQQIMAAGSEGVQMEWAGLKLEHYELKQQEEQFDLMFEVAESIDKISGYLKYNVDLFKERTITGISNRFKILLKNILSHRNIRISDLNIFEERKIPSIKRIERNQLIN